MVNFKRILHFALTDFYRNRGASVAAIFVLTIITLLITGLFFVRGASSFLIETVQNKIDITAYFKEDVDESDILHVKSEIIKMSSAVRNVEYVSAEDALADFTEKHKDSTVLSNALYQVGDNPFLPALNITTDGNTQLYEQIADTLGQGAFSDLVEKVDYYQKKDTIEKVFSITSSINRFGIVVGIILVLIAILVVFNTIKLVVDSSKEEINTMRIVGASSWFVKLPFIIQGAIFGSVAFVICFAITLLLVWFLSVSVGAVMPGFSLFKYFISHILIVILIQLVFGVGLGVLSSLIAVNKYLKV
ncbi:MAG: ABC transporter permease [Candidatus Staskawiczbacteria bacterium]|nr:ABC transporter permease [Candidatus Staskawiczbacteria bacterium]